MTTTDTPRTEELIDDWIERCLEAENEVKLLKALASKQYESIVKMENEINKRLQRSIEIASYAIWFASTKGKKNQYKELEPLWQELNELKETIHLSEL